MTATLAHSPWTAPAGAASPWLFGQEVRLEGGARRALRWALKRNTSITPHQLGAVYLALCLLAAIVCAGFWLQGARVITAFAGVELLLVGAALLAYARHAADGEVLTLAGRSLAVEQRRGSRTDLAAFDAAWTAVEPAAGQGSLVQISERGKTVRVGRFLRPELRAAFAQELRLELRRAARLTPHSGTETK